MGKSAPKAPDYTKAAEAQAESSKEVTNMQTYANRPDQYTPFGNQTWEAQKYRDPATGQMVTRWIQNTDLAPESQRALDAQLGLTAARSELGASLMPRAQQEFGQAMDWSQFQEAGGIPGQREVNGQDIQRNLSTDGLPDIDPTQRYYDQAEDAIYNQFASRADKRFGQDEQSMRDRLYAQGLREGDEAFDREVENFNQQKNDAYQQAQYQATIGAGEEAQRYFGMDSGARGQLFGERGQQGAFYNQAADQALRQDLSTGQYNYGQEMQGSQYQTQLRQQQIAEEMQQRGFSLNEINALLTGQQVGMPSMPGFQNATKSDSTNYLGAAQMQGQAALDAWNAEQQATQGMMSGIGSIAGGAMMFSDRRLKKNIKRIGTFRGYPLYSFEYIWGEKSIGVMSDEVDPRHVVKHSSGYDMVNYGSL